MFPTSSDASELPAVLNPFPSSLQPSALHWAKCRRSLPIWNPLAYNRPFGLSARLSIDWSKSKAGVDFGEGEGVGEEGREVGVDMGPGSGAEVWIVGLLRAVAAGAEEVINGSPPGDAPQPARSKIMKPSRTIRIMAALLFNKFYL